MYSIILKLITMLLYITITIIYSFENKIFLCILWSIGSICWGFMTGLEIKKYKEKK